jgi:hypothetical protein
MYLIHSRWHLHFQLSNADMVYVYSFCNANSVPGVDEYQPHF